MAQLSGLVGTATELSNTYVIDMSDEIVILEPGEDYFIRALNKLGRSEARGRKIEWLEDQYTLRLSTLAASATSAATTLSVAPTTYDRFREGDLVRICSTGEVVRVTAVSANDTLTVTRAVGGTTAASAASGVDVIIVSNSSAEGASSGTSLIFKKTAAYNYVQIHRTPFVFTNTDLWVARYGEDEPGREIRKKLVEHRRGIDQTFFWGARGTSTTTVQSTTQNIGYCGGMDEFVSTNIHSVGGALAATGVDGYLRADLQYSREPFMFCAPVPAMAMSNFYRSIWAPNPGSTDGVAYGVKVNRWLDGAYGRTVPMTVYPNWNDFQTGSNQMGGRVYIVDMSAVKLRTAPAVRGKPRFAALRVDIQAPDADVFAAEYLSEFSLEVRNEKQHAVWRGITG
jgi:hypothetical protein